VGQLHFLEHFGKRASADGRLVRVDVARASNARIRRNPNIRATSRKSNSNKNDQNQRAKQYR